MATTTKDPHAVEHETDEHIPDEDEIDESSSVRFEDLTVDDDLPIIERVVRFSRSSIALQRLVHVKMLAETAELAGYVHCETMNVWRVLARCLGYYDRIQNLQQHCLDCFSLFLSIYSFAVPWLRKKCSFPASNRSCRMRKASFVSTWPRNCCPSPWSA